MSSSSYTHIIWDWNGTLLDDTQLCILIINGLLETQQLPPVTAELYRSVFRFPVRDYYQDLGFNFSLRPFEDLSTDFITAFEQGRSHCNLMPGARIILEYLDDNGYTQSILSASRLDYLQAAVSEYALSDKFFSLSGLSDHHAGGKLEAGKDLLATLDVDPALLLLVGDTLHDAEVAAALNVDCCLVPNGHQNRDRLLNAGVPLLDSLLALIRFL